MKTWLECVNEAAVSEGWITGQDFINAQSENTLDVFSQAAKRYIEQSNSHKHSVVRESPIVKEEIDLYLKGQRDTIKLIFDYILGLDEPFGSGGQAQNVSDGLPKRKSFKERLAEEMEKAKIGQPRG